MLAAATAEEEQEEEEDERAGGGQIKVDFYSSHIGHAGCGLIYGKILRHSRF